ncbi:MAG: hypothetical protein WBG86_18785 [Polyangiales bacterium]
MGGMRWGLVLALLLHASPVRAQNSEDVLAGSDVALTGGAVVANVQTGGAMWFNPAGVARVDSRSLGLTGAVLSYSVIKAPGALSLSSGEQSAGDFSSVEAIPRALTFVASPRPQLRWGLGFFFTRVVERFTQDSVSSSAGAEPPAEFFASVNQTRRFYHVSSAVAWKQSEKLLVGGGLDLVLASQRFNQFFSGSYDGGAGGATSFGLAENISGGGIQIKGGVQWAPIEEIRVGFMVSTPSYLAFLSQQETSTRTIAPPGGPPDFEGTQIKDTRGAWAGVEAGLTRLGVAWLQRWGWVEADLIIRFPLETPALDLDWKVTPNTKVGAILRVSERLKLGLGFATDFSAIRSLQVFGASEVDLYTMTVGVDFSNRAAPPEAGEKGFYLALAIAAQYSIGRGNLVGAVLPNTFDPPLIETNIVPIRVNTIAVNVAVKAAF